MDTEDLEFIESFLALTVKDRTAMLYFREYMVAYAFFCEQGF